MLISVLIDINHVDLMMLIHPLGFLADFPYVLGKHDYLVHLLEDVHDIQIVSNLALTALK